MKIPYGKQDITQADIDAVVDVLKSDFLTQGPKVPLFERKVAEKVDAKYALAVNSATSALHIACLALGLQRGDYLWTSPITFVASANCGLYCGAKVDFVDVDPNSYNICPKKLREKLVDSRDDKKLPKILVVVHFTGQSCDMAEIHNVAKEFGVKIIEDASHAIGGKYGDRYIGCCEYSEITVFSFHPVKIITTAEGGMALTNNHYLAKKMDLMRSHGITRDKLQMLGEVSGPWVYQQLDLGYNYRMTELQGALGLSQMERLDTYVAARNNLADRYKEKLALLPLILPTNYKKAYSAFHLFVVCLKIEEVTLSRKDVFEKLRNEGIGVNVHYIPVHTQPYYQQQGFRVGDFPNAEQYYETAISIPLFHGMSHEEQDYVVDRLVEVLR